MCCRRSCARLRPSAGAGADQVALETSARPPNTANIKAPGAGAGVGPPFAEYRDHEIATGPIIADATSDLAGSMAPSAYANRPRPFPHPAYNHPPGSPHGTARMP
jgi:hypothetical protein